MHCFSILTLFNKNFWTEPECSWTVFITVFQIANNYSTNICIYSLLYLEERLIFGLHVFRVSASNFLKMFLNIIVSIDVLSFVIFHSHKTTGGRKCLVNLQPPWPARKEI